MSTKFTSEWVNAVNQRTRVNKIVAKVSGDMPAKKRRVPSYNPKIVTAFFAEHGIPAPEYEWRFHPERRWAFDLAWPNVLQEGVLSVKEARLLAIEVQGGIFSQGRHNRGAAMLKEWEKLNTAACMGWRILYCQPDDLCMMETVTMIKRALGV